MKAWEVLLEAVESAIARVDAMIAEARHASRNAPPDPKQLSREAEACQVLDRG